jgi:predicted TIM-barrel fold metal-dependent hydrolase
MLQNEATLSRSGPAPDKNAVVISCDSHTGPLLKEHLRQYCPKKYLEEFDAFAEHATFQRFTDQPGVEPHLSPARNQLTQGGWDMTQRLADMDYDGIAGEIVFHGLNVGRVEPLPFGGLFGTDRADSQLVGLGRHIYNQWLADVCSVEPERHAGLVHLPMWDVEAAVLELEWARQVGLRGINFPRPQPGLLPYNHPDWEPLWAAAEALAMPLTTHAQSGGDASFAAEGKGNHIISILEVTGQNSRKAFPQLVFGGIFEKHPGLKLVFTEQPGQWWQPMLSEMDSLFMLLGHSDTDLKRMPSEYASDHLYVGATCLASFEAHDAVDNGYSRNVLWGSDYPHPEGSWQLPRYEGEPSMSKLAMRDTFADIPADDCAIMLGENAARVYGFDLDALANVAERIDAPTFAELATPLEREPEDRSTRGAAYAFRRHGAYH